MGFSLFRWLFGACMVGLVVFLVPLLFSFLVMPGLSCSNHMTWPCPRQQGIHQNAVRCNGRALKHGSVAEYWNRRSVHMPCRPTLLELHGSCVTRRRRQWPGIAKNENNNGMGCTTHVSRNRQLCVHGRIDHVEQHHFTFKFSVKWLEDVIKSDTLANEWRGWRVKPQRGNSHAYANSSPAPPYWVEPLHLA